MARARRLYAFQPWVIKAIVPQGIVGVYVLYIKNGQTCKPIYTGRSDTDLRRRLCRHPLIGIATYFDYYVCNTKMQGFLLEAANYHAMEHLVINKIHPASPKGKEAICPFCKCSLKHLKKVV